MVTDNTSPRQTAFTSPSSGPWVSAPASQPIAHTITTAIGDDVLPAELSRPGHVFPLRARDGGVLVRPGHTEASVDLARLAGFKPAGVICEVMNDDGTMARRPQLVRFAKKHKLALLAIADLITYRLSHERLVRRIGETTVRRESCGEFTAYAYTTDVDPAVHLALVMGEVAGKKPVLTRVHRATPLGDLLDSMTGEGSLKRAFDQIKKEKRGVIVLLQKHLSGLDVLTGRPPSNEKPVVGTRGKRG